MNPTAASPIAIHAIALAGALFLDVLAAEAGDSNELGEHRRHETHVHGSGALNIALEDGEVHIELDSPAANVLGFEHAPSTEEDHEALEKAVALLKDGERLFHFPGDAQCRLAEAGVASSLLDRAADNRHDDEYRHNLELRHEHTGHAAESEQDRHKDDHRKDGDVHVDIGASWQFDCANPEALERLEVGLFQAFPATERLHVQLITTRGQVAAELMASDPVLNF